MRQVRRRSTRNRRGATLVAAAVLMVLLLSMAALAIDYGMIKATKAEAQRAMDAAALAGATMLRASDLPLAAEQLEEMAEDTAVKYAMLHRVGNQTIVSDEVAADADAGPEAKRVTVTFARAGIRTWLANLFGSRVLGLRAMAEARIEEGVGPFSIDSLPVDSPPVVLVR